MYIGYPKVNIPSLIKLKPLHKLMPNINTSPGMLLWHILSLL